MKPITRLNLALQDGLSKEIFDHIRKLSRTRYHLAFTISLIALYIFMSARVIEMAWQFRVDTPPL